MKNKVKTTKRLLAVLVLTLLISGIYLTAVGARAIAADQLFSIDAEVLSSDQPTYNIRLTIENQGEDWEGTVRLMVDGVYGGTDGCAYDTVLSLPQGSTKQFAVKVPKNSLDRTDGVVKVTLLDAKSQKTAEKDFPRLLQNGTEGLPMGILSDEYASLTYLDMGGNEWYYHNSNYPIKLVELNQDNLEKMLDSLAILVIDSYHTNILADETVAAIEQWTDNGGVLIVGTGSYAEDTLSGLHYLELESRTVNAQVENMEDIVSDSQIFMQLSLAELIDTNGIYEERYDSLALAKAQGNGAVGVLPYALSELGRLDAAKYQEDTSQEYIVECILDSVGSFANARYRNGQYSYNYDTGYSLARFMRLLGNGSNSLEFGGLRWIVVLYVIFVGPVLYLILRFAKKRDFYWIVVPAAALIGIFLVYWAGRGFKVVSTNVYSVTVENLADTGNAVTYLHCYDAGHKEWALRLAQGYEYAGPAPRYYYGSSDSDKYYYHVNKEGEQIFFGINPTTGFEDGYFQAGIAKEPENGSLSWNKDRTFSNGTGHDFLYFMVIEGDSLYVYKDVAAGETIPLTAAGAAYSNTASRYSDSIVDSYLYGYMSGVRLRKEEKDVDIMAALGIGVVSVYAQGEPNGIVLIGVTRDWDKVVDDDCSEVSYRCLYAIMED